eukprot:10559047-Prorocentrum_lima.AAC.1
MGSDDSLIQRVAMAAPLSAEPFPPLPAEGPEPQAASGAERPGGLGPPEVEVAPHLASVETQTDPPDYDPDWDDTHARLPKLIDRARRVLQYHKWMDRLE